MKASTLVQASATIVTVVNLKEGDVYKRMEKMYDKTFELKFGVVTSVMSNGEDVGVTAIEFDGAKYSNLTASIKVFGSNSEVSIFAAEPDEVSIHFDKLIEFGIADLNAKRAEITKTEEILDQIYKVKHSAENGELTAPEHKVLTVNPDDVSE